MVRWFLAQNKFKQLGLPEPWFVITHTRFERHKRTRFLLTTGQERWSMFSEKDQTFWGTPSPSVKARKNDDEEVPDEEDSLRESLTMRKSLEMYLFHRTLTTASVLSLIKTVPSWVVQLLWVITNQGSCNPNCLNFLKDAYKVYQGAPPTYWQNKVEATTSRQVITTRRIVFTAFFIKLTWFVSASLTQHRDKPLRCPGRWKRPSTRQKKEMYWSAKRREWIVKTRTHSGGRV